MVTALFCFSEKVPKFKRNRLGLITNFVHQKEEISAINMKHQTTYLECLWYLRCISKVGGVTGYCKTQFLGIFNQHLYEMHTSISHLHTFTMKPRLSFFFFFFFWKMEKNQIGAKPTSDRFHGNKLYPKQKCKNRNFGGNHTIIPILNALQR